MREIGDIVRAFERGRGEPFALATLVRSRGSSYRRSGARMLISRDGRTAGSLSGGCLEEEIIERAREVLRAGAPALMEFDTQRRFGCNGAIEVLVECVSDSFLAGLAGYFRARRICLIATIFEGPSAAPGSHFVEEADAAPENALLQRIEPPPRIIIIGNGPENAALRVFAETLGWPALPMESAAELQGAYDKWTAAVVKTHNYGRDFAALRALLPLGLRYIGLIGPRKRRDQLLGDLHDTGLDAGENLFAPAGLDLGGESPECIALAIVSEIQAVFAGGSGQSLRGRKTPIHAAAGQSAALIR